MFDEQWDLNKKLAFWFEHPGAYFVPVLPSNLEAAVLHIVRAEVSRKTVPISPRAAAALISTEWPTIYEDHLVTLGWFADYQSAIGDRESIKARFEWLEQRIKELESPWWKRWFSR